MILKRFLLPLPIFCLLGLYLAGQNPRGDDVFNPGGWKLPGKELFDLTKVEKVSLPGVPREIIAETWISRKDSASRSTNLPIEDELRSSSPALIDNVFSLTLYKTTDGRIICCQCIRDFRDAQFSAVGTAGYAVSNLVCDLDGDGSYESQFETWEFDPEYTVLISSIARIRLGLSEESWLVSRMLKTILRMLVVRK